MAARRNCRLRRWSTQTLDKLLVTEIVTLTHSNPQLASLSAQVTGQLNRLAALSALVFGDHDGQGQLVCKTGIFSTDQAAAERNYAPLICMEAAMLGWHAACLANGIGDSVDPERDSPWTGTDQLPPYDTADFEAVKAASDRIGLLGCLAPGQYTVEFPWDDGAISQSLFAYDDGRERLRGLKRFAEEDITRMGGRTSLLWIRTTERHSFYGNGVLATLEIPLPVDDPDLPRLFDELNRWELSGHDLPPLFGAWSIGTRAPTFVTFIPNQLCMPILFLNLFHWSKVRHFRVRAWLEASRVGH